MRTLYLDCGMGAAGDMLTGALLELLPDPENFLKELNSLGIPGVTVSAVKSVRCGITGTHIHVDIFGQQEDDQMHPHHHHCGLWQIEQILSRLPLPDKVSSDVLAVYRLIAEAESHVHGMPMDQIHFHEVGTLDAVADVTAVCLLMHRLDPEKIVASPVHVGSGTVRCAHGILPVPAPAAAYLLQGIPIYGGAIPGELCTPTGAALLKHFVTEFGSMPAMTVSRIGYGMGRKDFEQANCLRALLGQSDQQAQDILELSCNVDDMTGEAIGFALEQAMEQGALDAFTQAIGMKKSRPGVKFTVLCRPEEQEAMIQLLFRHTTTLGVRETRFRRYALNRTSEEVQTSYGTVRRKCSSGYGVSREKYEYEDLARIAREQDLSIQQIEDCLP